MPSPANKIMPADGTKYRLITRSDMDGLICAVLLTELEIINDILFVHPKDMQDGKVDVTSNDITTNLPYMKDAYLSFDHHSSEIDRLGDNHKNNYINMPDAPSAARVVYDYFGGEATFPSISMDMMDAVDKADAANFSKEEILAPTGWALLSFIMDSRTGLGRFRDFNISNYQLMLNLIKHCTNYNNIEDILALPDVKERVDLYFEQQVKFEHQLETCAVVHDNLVVLDLLNESTIWAGNRFMIYALYPQCNISIHMMWGRNKQNTVFAIGKSILDRSSKTDIGKLALKYDGGGHVAAGGCQIDNLKAYDTLDELIEAITNDG